MSNEALTYLIAAVVGVLSLSLWAWLVAVPAVSAYANWWQRVVAVVLSVYVLAAMVGAGGVIGAGFLWYYDRIGGSGCRQATPPSPSRHRWTWPRSRTSRTPSRAVQGCPRSCAPRPARSTRRWSCSTTRAPCSPSPPARRPTSAR